jgi:hypothetical protein
MALATSTEQTERLYSAPARRSSPKESSPVAIRPASKAICSPGLPVEPRDAPAPGQIAATPGLAPTAILQPARARQAQTDKTGKSVAAWRSP